MYRGSEVDLYTKMQSLRYELKARAVKLHASRYKQFNCQGTINNLSEIGKRKHEFVCRGTEEKLSLIVLSTCTCGVISHLNRKKLDVAERGEGVPGTISKCNFTAAPQARKERFLCLFQITIINNYFLNKQLKFCKFTSFNFTKMLCFLRNFVT